MRTLSKMRTGRRTVLAGAGASGLAMAAAVFGRSTPAFAANWGCCSLEYAPPNLSWSTCSNATYMYIWSCTFGTVGPTYRYQCCERYTNSSRTTINGSAAKSNCIANC